MTTLAKTSVSSSAAPGVLGFLVVFCLAVILVFVFRSMSKHIRKVNDAARSEEDARIEAARNAAEGGPRPEATPAKAPAPAPADESSQPRA